MPILLQDPIQRISEQTFHKLDYEIMRLSFDIHNELGRFYDESIYQRELEQRCHIAGIRIERELEIKLIHEDFVKPLYIDLLINGSTVYELKACKAIAAPNRIQTLNYLFSTNTQQGKLINFGTTSVEHEFISTHLDSVKRQKIHTEYHDWDQGILAETLRKIVTGLLFDWGAFLGTNLYLDAIFHLLAGKDRVLREIEIINNGIILGRQKAPLLSATESFCLTSVTNNISACQRHLFRFLNHTGLEYLHWINLNHQIVSFTSLKKKSFCP